MPSVTLRNATDTWANGSETSRNYGDARQLQVRSADRFAYIFFNRAAPLGSTIKTATLRVYYDEAWTGTRTLSVQRIAAAWKASRLTWQNRPGVTGATVSSSSPAGAAGTFVDFDVKALLQTVSDGAAWYGFRIASSEATARKLASAQGTSALRPTLTVEWSEQPQRPTTLRPSGNAAVSTNKPTLRFDFTDLLGDTTLAAVNVQIDPAANWAAPAWDSGWVTTGDPELDLDATSYPGLANLASTYWRVRVRDGAGLESLWSEDEQFRRADLGTVTITNPAASPNDVVKEPTPPLLWTYSATQAKWQVVLTLASDPSRVLASSGIQVGTETSWTPPKGVLTDTGPYRVTVKVWDNEYREATPDAAVYASAFRDFTVVSDSGVTPVAALGITQPEYGKPTMRLEWTRTTAPDKFVVRRNGRVIEDELLPEDALVSGITYAFEDDGSAPWRTQTWEVQAVVNHAASAWVQVSGMNRSRGIWLLDYGRDLAVWLAGKDGGSFTLGEEASVFNPVGATNVVRRVQAQRGYEGSLSGALVDREGQTARQSENDLLAMRDQPARPVRLVVGDLALRVVLGNIGIYPTPESLPPQRLARFDFWEAP